MRRSLFTRLLLCALLAGPGGPLQAATALDQRFDPRDPYPGGDLLAVMYRGGYFAQTFHSGKTGTLTGVDLLLSRREVMQTDLLFEVRTTVEGVPAPTLTPPGLTAIPHGAIPVDPEGQAGASKDWVFVDLSPFNIPVTEGDILAIVLKLDTGVWAPQDPLRNFEILWHGRIQNPYPGGDSFAHPPFPGAPWHPLIVDEMTCDLGFQTWVETVRTVSIVVRPGDEPGPVNLDSRGNVAVAILSAADFDAAQVDPSSIQVAGAPVTRLPTGRPMANLEEVSGDGLMDLVLHVSTSDLSLTGPEADIILTGSTFAGESIWGIARVGVVP